MHLLLQKYYFNQELVKLLSDEFASTERWQEFTSPSTATPWAKETKLIAGDSMLHEIDENTVRSKTKFS